MESSIPNDLLAQENTGADFLTELDQAESFLAAPTDVPGAAVAAEPQDSEAGTGQGLSDGLLEAEEAPRGLSFANSGDFLAELEAFFKSRGTEFKIPKFYGVEVDLYKLWRIVSAHGGFEKVTSNKLWRSVGDKFHPPKSCTTLSWSFRGFYEKALLEYEKHVGVENLPRQQTAPKLGKRAKAGGVDAVRGAAAQLGVAVGSAHPHPGGPRVGVQSPSPSPSSKRMRRHDSLGGGPTAAAAGVERTEAKTGPGGATGVEDREGSGFPALRPIRTSLPAVPPPATSSAMVRTEKSPNGAPGGPPARGGGQKGVGVPTPPVKSRVVPGGFEAAALVSDEGQPADWVRINVQRTTECFEIYALVPGLLREEVRVQIESGGKLVIAGDPEQPENPWGVTAFKKVILLPTCINAHQTSAVITLHGQLYVRAPIARGGEVIGAGAMTFLDPSRDMKANAGSAFF